MAAHGASQGRPALASFWNMPAAGGSSADDNNYAEYAALLVALEYAVAFRCRRMQVFSDSEVVVKQIRGDYSCQSAALRHIHGRCKELIATLEDFAISHIRREFNNDANRLVSAAMQRAGSDNEEEFLVLLGLTPPAELPASAPELEPAFMAEVLEN
jgi:ribonuclease HI